MSGKFLKNKSKLMLMLQEVKPQCVQRLMVTSAHIAVSMIIRRNCYRSFRYCTGVM